MNSRASSVILVGLTAVLLGVATPTLGADYFISPTGSDTNRCSNQTTDACASFPRCAQLMAPGDTCFAVDGTYYVRDTNPTYPNQGWMFDMPGGRKGAPKRFTSLSQDPSKVVIKSSHPGSQDTLSLQGASGETTQARYLEFDHLTLEGRMDPFVTSGSPLHGLAYHHNIARCPNRGTGGGNHAFIQTIATPTEMHRDIRIYENLFLMEESCVALLPPDSPPEWRCDRSSSGTCSLYLVDLYHTNGAIIENNDFVNTSSVNMVALVMLKQGNKDAIVRYNYVRGNGKQDPTGIWINDCDGVLRANEWGDRSPQGGSPRCNNRIYQNILHNTSGGPQPWDETDVEELIYNNTIYGSATRCLGAAVSFPNGATGHRIFNNICAGPKPPADGHVAWPTYGAGMTTCMSQQAYFDNNLYWPAPSGTSLWKDCELDTNSDGTADQKQSYQTIGAWIAHLSGSGQEQRSRVADPVFVNAPAGDFRLAAASPALSGGRGGGWPSGLGAYVTGHEAIGCTVHLRCHASDSPLPPNTSGPAPVLGLIRSDAR